MQKNRTGVIVTDDFEEEVVWSKTYLVCELTSPRRLFLQSNLFQETSELCNAEDFAIC